MNQPGGMGSDRFPCRHRPCPGRLQQRQCPVLLDTFVEAASGHQFHDQKLRVPFLPDVVDRGHVGMIELTGGLGLRQKTRQGGLIGRQMIRQNLDRDVAADHGSWALNTMPMPPLPKIWLTWYLPSDFPIQWASAVCWEESTFDSVSGARSRSPQAPEPVADPPNLAWA